MRWIEWTPKMIFSARRVLRVRSGTSIWTGWQHSNGKKDSKDFDIYFRVLILLLIRKEIIELLMEFNLFSILFICKSELLTDYRFIILCIINLILIQTYK